MHDDLVMKYGHGMIKHMHDMVQYLFLSVPDVVSVLVNIVRMFQTLAYPERE